MSLLQKPKRTLSNLSLKQLERAKEICRSSFQEYKEKFCFEPDWSIQHKKKRLKSSYEKKKEVEAQKIIGGRHTYSVQGKTNNPQAQSCLQGRFKNKSTLDKPETKERPSTANFMHKKALKAKEDLSMKNLSGLFHNEQLLSTFQQSELVQKGKQSFESMSLYKKIRSASLTCTSVNPNNFIVKTGIPQPMQESNLSEKYKGKPQVQQMIKSMLSIKENFYNPYNIGPKNPYRKPIKHLRNQSIEQLKKLCRQERNINFNAKINQTTSQSKPINLKVELKSAKQNTFTFLNDKMSPGLKGETFADNFKRGDKKLFKKINPTRFSKDRLKNFSRNLLLHNHSNSLVQVNQQEFGR